MSNTVREPPVCPPLGEPQMLSRFGAATLAVESRALVKRYGRTTALDGLDLAVPEGAVYLFAGENGAGKTTTLRLLLGLTRPDAGTAAVFGLDPAERGEWVRAAAGYVPEGDGPPYPGLAVGLLLCHHAAYYETWDAAYATRLIAAFEIDLEKRYGRLSKGQRWRVQLVMALAHRPPLLLFDEPTDGLDPVARDSFFAVLAEHLAATPTTIVLSTHVVGEAELLADHVGVLRQGRLTAQVDRRTLDARLKRYRAEVPAGWTPPALPASAVLTRREAGGEIDWVVWGEEPEVSCSLAAAGARVRAVTALDLAAAVRVLMRPEEEAP